MRLISNLRYSRRTLVIGVAKDGKYIYWSEPAQAMVWTPFAQEFNSHMAIGASRRHASHDPLSRNDPHHDRHSRRRWTRRRCERLRQGLPAGHAHYRSFYIHRSTAPSCRSDADRLLDPGKTRLDHRSNKHIAPGIIFSAALRVSAPLRELNAVTLRNVVNRTDVNPSSPEI